MATTMVFPGQGSQSVGMMAGLEAHEAVASTFAEASEVLGYDLWRVVSQGPPERLNATEVTQPAMLAAGVATWRLWRAAGGAVPCCMAGHSLGEYTALVCAGALDFPEAVRLVARRGRFMQEAVPEGEGAMAAILGLEDAAVATLCREAARDQVVAPANYNSPGQVVVAGHREAVARAVAAAKAAGAKRAVVLPVSVPSHCALMEPAARRLEEALADVSLRRPEIPVVNNVDVAAPEEPAAIADALVRQLHRPVRWVEVVGALKARGARTLVECGPGKVLVGLNRRIDRAMPAFALTDQAALAEALEATGGER